MKPWKYEVAELEAAVTYVLQHNIYANTHEEPWSREFVRNRIIDLMTNAAAGGRYSSTMGVTVLAIRDGISNILSILVSPSLGQDHCLDGELKLTYEVKQNGTSVNV